MAKVSINIIKDWFKNQMKPPQEQFWSWLDSFWHKDEPIPQSAVENLVTTLQKKADLVNGVVPENQLPFSVLTSEVIALGTVSVTGNKVNLAVHSSGNNTVRVKGRIIERAFPNEWTISPIVADGFKVLRGYALQNEDDFFLAEGAEFSDITDPEIPVGALELFKITLSAANAIIEETPTNYFKSQAEDPWRNHIINSNLPSLLSIANSVSCSFNLMVSDSIMTPKINGFRTKADKSTRDGIEITLYNDSPKDIEFVASVYEEDAIGKTFGIKAGFIVKPATFAKMKRRNNLYELLPAGEGLDDSGLVDKMHSYWDSNLGMLISSGLKFVSGAINQLEFSGRIKADGLVLPANSNTPIANRLRSDGNSLFFANNLGVEKILGSVSTISNVYNPPTTAQIVSLGLVVGDYYHNTNTNQRALFNGTQLQEWYFTSAEWLATSTDQKNAVKYANISA